MSIIVKVKRPGSTKSEKYTPRQFRDLVCAEGIITEQQRDAEILTVIAELYTNVKAYDTTVKIVIKRDV